jgi:DNA repair exonuclease SbcCD ATPase subunit
MFAEDGTVIRLNNVSTTAKGEERARLSVDAFHKGRPAKRVKDFSGGEQSRASLAFQLGLSDLYKSPILLVDEGFTGLSEEDYESCLEVLRVAASDRLVLVIEHNVPEAFFDKVERIGVSGS